MDILTELENKNMRLTIGNFFALAGGFSYPFLLLVFSYFVYYWSFLGKQATLGQRILGLSVVQLSFFEHKEGQKIYHTTKIKPFSAFIRALLFFYPIGFYLVIFNLLFMLLSKKGMAIHDRWLGTVVLFKN